MDLMTRQRAIAATDTQIHIHHEHIGPVYYSGFNLLCYRRQPALIGERVQANIVRILNALPVVLQGPSVVFRAE